MPKDLEILTESTRGITPAHYFDFLGKSVCHLPSGKLYCIKFVVRKKGSKLAHFACQPLEHKEDVLIILCNAFLADSSSYEVVRGKPTAVRYY